ncbi:long-chain-fatty-acid--CoA ligase [Alloalcanivorax marinus]|uniref:long-chain-fatty-acid--CoA ligase n=1 Tax=Alloalcanivorax marinus TaxID=1177169 RepID=UPI001931515E|nr:long-chain-fatty-acid--CoA ligase [Alloalcanivorax marinus]MBL7249918.1 AMP-binding protein [Alloalcanivorax marinus]
MNNNHLQFYPRGLRQDIRVPSITLPEALSQSARRFPDKPALVFYETEVSYAQLQEQVERLAGYLRQHWGVVRGERVLLLAQNCPQFVIAFYAVTSIGAAVVPVNAMSTADELQYYLDDSGAHLAICAEELYPSLRPCVDNGTVTRTLVFHYTDGLGTQGETDPPMPAWLTAERRPPRDPAVVFWDQALQEGGRPAAQPFDSDQLCVLPYTSGTTGKPKGCRHSHRTLITALHASTLWRAFNSEAVFLSVAPMFHMLGLQNSMNLPLFLGGTLVILPRWDRHTAARLIEARGVTIWGAPPSMVMGFFSDPEVTGHDLSSLSLIFGGGAAMPEAVSRKLNDDHGIVFNESYGLTETAAFLHANPVHRNKRQCLGVPTFGVHSLIIHPDTGVPLPDNEQGELVTSGGQVMLGYWNNDQANRDAFIEIEGRRYFRTGDLAYRDEDGYFFLTDRLKRMITVSGYKVWPAEIENLMYRHPGVREACVVGVPDKEKGERVQAVLVLDDDYRDRLGENDIIEWARSEMAVYKAPRSVSFVDELPKSAAGKILWRHVQEEYAARAVQ